MPPIPIHSLVHQVNHVPISPGHTAVSIRFSSRDIVHSAYSGSDRSQVSQSSTAMSERLRRTLSTVRDFSQLNVDQQNAVMKVLAGLCYSFMFSVVSDYLVSILVTTAKDYALIVGLPGTGKTSTIAFLVLTLARLGKSVLLTAHTHTAVDNILIKLQQYDSKFVRLGRMSAVCITDIAIALLIHVCMHSGSSSYTAACFGSVHRRRCLR